MKTRGVTFKLFMLIVAVFLCFYAMIIFFQLFFFEDFYKNQKMSRIETKLAAFSREYAREGWENGRLLRETARFGRDNKGQLAVVTPDGYVKYNDPYRLELKKTDGSTADVTLSSFLNQFGSDLLSLHLHAGDTIEVLGELDNEGGVNVIYPLSIRKPGSSAVGYPNPQEQSASVISYTGVVTEVELPDYKNLISRQGLLFLALEEWFPLSDEHLQTLTGGEMVIEEWIEPWTGVHNVIAVQPVKSEKQNMELLFSVTSLQEISEANSALQMFFVYAGLGGALLIVMLSFVLSRMVTKPLIALDESAKRMSNLDFTDIAPLERSDEFGSLSDSLHVLSYKLDTTLSELNQANEKLLEDVENREHMERLQQQFFSNASHELKTPLSIIKSYAEGIRDGVNRDKQDYYLDVIVEESEKMETLLQDMLYLFKLDSGTVKLKKRWFTLSDKIEEVVSRLAYPMRDKSLDAVIIPTDESPVYADVERIEQVIYNLMVNAIKYAAPGSPITIRITGSAAGAFFSIENQGLPIPEGLQSRLWERFYRLEDSRSRETGGTGLGLSIVKLILDLHGFTYGVDNTAEGVRFYVSLINHSDAE